MSDGRVGRGLRALRIRLAWRQSDVARRSRLSQSVVSRLERGHFDRVTLGLIRRHARSLDADVDLVLRWRGGGLDRLMDEGHAAIVSDLVSLLSGLGWEVATEVTYSVYGERGSVDVLAFRDGHLLVCEVKTEIVSVEATIRKHDEKVRLAASISRARLGWVANYVSRLLVIADASTERRAVARFAIVFERSYPIRGRAVRSWLRRPAGNIGALLFLSPSPPRTGRKSRSRIPPRGAHRAPPTPHESGARDP